VRRAAAFWRWSAKWIILAVGKEKTMGLHKLEIEVTDEVLSRIDAAAARANRSREEVVAEKLKDLPPVEDVSDEEKLRRRRAFLDEISRRASRHSSNLSSEEILRQVREFREDR
jgi:hypothetical protein